MQAVLRRPGMQGRGRVNIYDVLRRVVEGRPFQEHEKREALELLDDMERLNVLGTVARQLNEGHEHEWVKQTPNWRRCSVCSLEEAIR